MASNGSWQEKNKKPLYIVLASLKALLYMHSKKLQKITSLYTNKITASQNAFRGRRYIMRHDFCGF